MRAEGLEPPRAFAHRLLSSSQAVLLSVRKEPFCSLFLRRVLLSSVELGTPGGRATDI